MATSGYAKASLGKRILAYIIDGVIASVPMIILFPVGITPYLAASQVPGDPGFGTVLLFLLAILVGFGWAFLYTLFRDGLGEGQSLGKRLVGLMVVRLSDNQPCSKGNSLVRNIIGSFLSFIDILVALIHNKGNRVGDMLVSTQVIDKSEYGK